MSEVVEAPKGRSKPSPKVEIRAESDGLSRLADAGLVAGLLALTFLLGAFPLKDTDFWWHLRTGDLIRQTGLVPRVDTFTFGAEGHRWTDLHWVFQLLLSFGYERIGVPGLTLAKCAVTALGVGLLVATKKKSWPTWVVVLAWLPALLVLAGRMYIRPETLTLVYLAAFLAILLHWDRRPWLAFLLPAVQVAWVNSQGLFVLGPVVLTFALIDAALRRGAFATERRGWWRTVLIASGLTGLACLVNPYGIKGALYPLELASTMGNPIFEKIGELKPLPTFIQEAGWSNGPLLIHMATIVVGVLSFLLPIFWRVGERMSRPKAGAVAPPKKKRRSRTKSEPLPEEGVRPSVFRFLLFASFTALSFKATRNSHQFAAVVGAVTAWNFAEWAAEVARSRAGRGMTKGAATGIGRGIAFVASAALFVATASGALYAWEGEGRTVGLDEEPHWFPHEAVDVAGRPGMPRRSVCFHNGHAALYEYKYAPDRKTYADARLEVIGPALFKAYTDLGDKIAQNSPGWEDDLEGLGRPLVLTDNIQASDSATTATMLTSRHYRCVWFDPVAALFVHDSYAAAGSAFDFAAWHFGREARPEPADAMAERMQAKTCWNLIHNLSPALGTPRPGASELSRKLIWAGLDHARALQRLDPGSADGWKWAGMIEAYRDPAAGDPIPRFRMAFDPIFDLSAVRASADLRKAHGLSPRDVNVIVSRIGLDLQRGMYAPALERLDDLMAIRPSQSHERKALEQARGLRPGTIARLGTPPASLKWANLSELHRLLGELYDHGRVAEAADLLESAYPAVGRTWEVSDGVATLRLHLGEPERAARLWAEANGPPSEALRQARIGAARLAAGDFEGARAAYRAAIGADPKRFDAQYGLAILESDAGRAPEALAAAKAAAEVAPNGTARAAARQIVEGVAPHVPAGSAVRTSSG